MQRHKPVNSRNNRSTQAKIWRLSKNEAIAIFIVAFFSWLFSSAYIFGQFEIKQSTLLLNREGCMHLMQLGITPQPQADSDTCRIKVPFRSNLQDGGGRISVGERVIRIPEHQLVYALPLAEQHWSTRDSILMAWEVISVLLLAGSMWLTEFCIRRERE
jgi:hypothetical protein